MPPLQVTGEAVYTDDMKLSGDQLVGALVTSARPHARITRLDASAALQVLVGLVLCAAHPGVMGICTQLH